MVPFIIAPCGGAHAGGHCASLLNLAHGGGEEGSRFKGGEGAVNREAATDRS